MSCTMGFRYLFVRGQLTSSVLLLGTQSSLALQNYAARILAAAAVQGGRVRRRPGLHRPLLPRPHQGLTAGSSSGPSGTCSSDSHGETEAALPAGGPSPLGPREAPAPHVSMAWGGKRGNGVGKHLFFLNKGTHFSRQMSWGGKDAAGDHQ